MRKGSGASFAQISHQRLIERLRVFGLLVASRSCSSICSRNRAAFPAFPEIEHAREKPPAEQSKIAENSRSHDHALQYQAGATVIVAGVDMDNSSPDQ
jgi:hypothetical protein